MLQDQCPKISTEGIRKESEIDSSDTQLRRTLDRRRVVVDYTEDELFVVSTAFKRLPSHKATLQLAIGALVDARYVPHKHLGRQLDGEDLPVWKRVVDRQALGLKQSGGRRPRRRAAPLPHDHGVGGTAHEQDLAAFPRDKGPARLVAVVVEQVVPDDRIGPQAAVTPVPVSGPVDDGLVAPVLVVVADSVGEGDGRVADLEVDDGIGVGYGVGPVQAREEVLVRADGAVELAWVVRGGDLLFSAWISRGWLGGVLMVTI